MRVSGATGGSRGPARELVLLCTPVMELHPSLSSQTSCRSWESSRAKDFLHDVFYMPNSPGSQMGKYINFLPCCFRITHIPKPCGTPTHADWWPDWLSCRSIAVLECSMLACAHPEEDELGLEDVLTTETAVLFVKLFLSCDCLSLGCRSCSAFVFSGSDSSVSRNLVYASLKVAKSPSPSSVEPSPILKAGRNWSYTGM